MSKIVVEVKEDGKITRYEADLTKMVTSVETIFDRVNSFFEDAFKGVFTKETTPSE